MSQVKIEMTEEELHGQVENNCSASSDEDVETPKLKREFNSSECHEQGVPKRLKTA